MAKMARADLKSSLIPEKKSVSLPKKHTPGQDRAGGLQHEADVKVIAVSVLHEIRSTIGYCSLQETRGAVKLGLH